MLNAILLIGSLLFAALRLCVAGHAGQLAASAHIWVGVLIAVAILKSEIRWRTAGLLFALTALETFLFFRH
jgi:hypothetical protein